MSEIIGQRNLIDQLDKNYNCLHRQYRLGGFERLVPYVRMWRPDESDPDTLFYEFCQDEEIGRPPQKTAGAVSFGEAIDDLYKLIEYAERMRPDIVASQALLFLRCKCLVYEATDYFFRVPPELGAYFIHFIENFPHQASEVERLAEKINGVPFPDRDERGKVIKAQLIAALCGANHLYRRHGAESYDRALELLEKLNRYIFEELPRHHEPARESFGLIGLAQYITGRVLSAKGEFAESRKAYRRSAEAYVARLRQKEEFHQRGVIKAHEYEEKISVTVRRAALVTAFGDGYLSFVSSRLTRALESLTLARAALSRNSGHVYLTYVDMLYWACQRAAHSSEIKVIEEVVLELRRCRDKLGDLVSGKHYFHRAGLHLALGLYHRARLSAAGAEADYADGSRYLNEAIEYAGRLWDGQPTNPHLLAAALIIKSRFLIAQYRTGKDADEAAVRRYSEALAEAEECALRARRVSVGIREMESEASATLGEVYTDLSEHYGPRSKLFYSYFDKAHQALQQGLEENRGENIRIEAVCYLRLTRLCLLNGNTETLAHQYFEEWKKIENQVDHDHWKVIAADLRRKLGSRYLLVKVPGTLNYKKWAEQLADVLLEEALKDFVSNHEGNHYKDEKLKGLLRDYLNSTIGYDKRKVDQLIRDRELVFRVKEMMARPREAHTRSRRKSYILAESKPGSRFKPESRDTPESD
jgi:hypothetical protein